jgi:hypothetical protein
MGFRLSVKEAKALGIEIPPRPLKYHNQPSRLDGIGFDSEMEMRRYCYLIQVEMAGQLSDMEIHPKYRLYADSPGKGAVYIGNYEGDFAYSDERGRVLEDVKGVLLPLYLLKRNLMLANYPTLVFMEVRQWRKRWSSTRLSLDATICDDSSSSSVEPDILDWPSGRAS